MKSLALASQNEVYEKDSGDSCNASEISQKQQEKNMVTML